MIRLLKLHHVVLRRGIHVHVVAHDTGHLAAGPARHQLEKLDGQLRRLRGDGPCKRGRGLAQHGGGHLPLVEKLALGVDGVLHRQLIQSAQVDGSVFRALELVGLAQVDHALALRGLRGFLVGLRHHVLFFAHSAAPFDF